MNKIAFSIFEGLAAINANADFVQLPGHIGGYGSDPANRIAENFQFAQASTVGSLIWWGGYFDPPSGPDNFTVQLYADTGGHPGSLVSGFDVGPISRTATGDFVTGGLYPEYRYAADLQSPFVAQAGTTYWLSITYPATKAWLWEISTSSDISSGVQGSFNNGPWQPLNDRTAFQLVVVPEPGSALLLVGAVACGMFVRRRHRFRKPTHPL